MRCVVIFSNFLYFCYFSFLNDRIYCHKVESDDGNDLSTDLSKDIEKLSEGLNDIVEESKESHELGDTINQNGDIKNLYDKAIDMGRHYIERHDKIGVLSHESDFTKLAMEALKRFWYHGQCRRNYNTLCPNGWRYDGENICYAPDTYHGPCNNVKEFTDITDRGKEEFAWKCEVEWPCVNDNPIDTNSRCPIEWVPISDTICIAPRNHRGICPPIIDFSHISTSTRIYYEEICGIRWPRLEIKPKSNEKTVNEAKLDGIIGESGIIHSLNV